MRALVSALYISLLVIPIGGIAQTCTAEWLADTDLKCGIGGTQDTIRCYVKAVRNASVELNRVYQDLEADLAEPGQLIRAQRAWLSYQREECGYQASGYDCDNGIAGMCSLSHGVCELRLTCERVERLREHTAAKCNGCPPRKSDGR